MTKLTSENPGLLASKRNTAHHADTALDAVDLVEDRHKDGGFAGAHRTHDGHQIAWHALKVDVLQNQLMVGQTARGLDFTLIYVLTETVHAVYHMARFFAVDEFLGLQSFDRLPVASVQASNSVLAVVHQETIV